MNAVLVNAAYGCLLATLLLGAVRRLVSRSVLDYIGNVSLGLGWIALTVFLAVRWEGGGFAPLSNQYESLVSLTWSVLLFHFIMTATSAIDGFGFWTALLALLFLGIASLLDRSVRPLVPALQSNWILFHVSTTLLAYAALGLSTLSSIIYLKRHRSVRRPDSGRTSDIHVTLGTGPSMAGAAAEHVDAFTYRAMVLGFILLTIGVILGAVWANEAWGTYWSWDPKETWSLITWFVYAGALHLRRVRKWTGARFAWLCIAGFVCVLFTYFGVNYLLAGLHSYA